MEKVIQTNSYDYIRSQLALMLRGESKSFDVLHTKVNVTFDSNGTFVLEAYPIDEPSEVDYHRTPSLASAVKFCLL